MSDQYRFQIAPELNIVFVKHFNELNIASILDRAKGISDHPDYGANLGRVVDCRNCKVDLSAEDIQAIAKSITSNREGRGRYTEVLIVSGLLSQGFSRMLLAHIEGLDIRYEVLQEDDPDLAIKVNEIMGIPPDFKFPEFLGYPFSSS